MLHAYRVELGEDVGLYSCEHAARAALGLRGNGRQAAHPHERRVACSTFCAQKVMAAWIAQHSTGLCLRAHKLGTHAQLASVPCTAYTFTHVHEQSPHH